MPPLLNRCKMLDKIPQVKQNRFIPLSCSLLSHQVRSEIGIEASQWKKMLN